MRKMTTITGFMQDVSYLLDKDVFFSVQEIQRHISSKDLLDWLEIQFPFGTESGLDFSMFKEGHRRFIHDNLESILGGYEGQERRKWGIEKNGLCLLISWSTEIVRDIAGRHEGGIITEEWID